MKAMALSKRKRNMMQLLVLAFFAFAVSIRFYVGTVNCLNTTVYAFSYKYGFVSRGFMGTVVRVINYIFHINLLTYDGLVRFSMFLNILYLIVLFFFFWNILKRTEQRYEGRILALMFVFGTFAFPEYLTEENFGRSDVCLVMISLFGCYLLLKEKFEWLIIPLSAVAVSIHQGYVLMFFHVILAILFTRIFDTEGKKRRKYIFIFTASLLTASALFLYFSFFSHQKDLSLYDEIYANASSYAHDGVVQYNVILNEIFGISPAADEWDEHLHNFAEFPIFVVFMLPYLVIAFRFFKNVLSEAKGVYKLKYLAVAVGAATILPDLLMKIDYGRWMFSIIFYYFVVILMLLAMGDTLIGRQFHRSVEAIKRRPAAVIFLLIYPLLFTPLEDVYICDFTRILVDSFMPPIYP